MMMSSTMPGDAATVTSALKLAPRTRTGEGTTGFPGAKQQAPGHYLGQVVSGLLIFGVMTATCCQAELPFAGSQPFSFYQRHRRRPQPPALQTQKHPAVQTSPGQGHLEQRPIHPGQKTIPSALPPLEPGSSRPPAPGSWSQELAQPITVQADQIIYDLARSVVFLQNNVWMHHGQLAGSSLGCGKLSARAVQAAPPFPTLGPQTVRADTLVYDQKTGHVFAQGHVQAWDGQGTSAGCQELDADQTFRHLRLTQAYVQSPDQEYLQVKTLESNPEGQHFEDALYTPCTSCQDRLPLWAVQARRIDHDLTKNQVVFSGARLVVRGRSVTPPISFFLPTKRRSGILIPTAGQSKELGGYAGVPIYWALSPHNDVTLTPLMTTSGGGLLAAQYRQALSRSGFISARGAINAPLTSGVKRRWGTRQVRATNPRGYGQLTMTLPLTPHFRLTSQEIWVSDPTFFATRPFFGHVQAPYLYAWTSLEGFSPQHYMRLRGMRWQGLQDQDRQRDMPRVYPDGTYQYTTPAHRHGQVRLQAQSLALSRSGSRQLHRHSLTGQGETQAYSPWGQRLVGFVRVYQVGYKVRGYGRGYGMRGYGMDFDDMGGEDTRKGTLATGRPRLWQTSQADCLTVRPRTSPRYAKASSFGQVGMETDAPLIVAIPGWPMTLTPKAQLILAPKSVRSGRSLPNEDSRGVLFDAGSLFARHRLGGLDRMDRGSRTTYGLQATLPGLFPGLSSQSLSRGTLPNPLATPLHLFVGQTYSFSHPDPLLSQAGAGKGASDVVGQASCTWQHLSFMYAGHYAPGGNRQILAGEEDRASWARLPKAFEEASDFCQSKRGAANQNERRRGIERGRWPGMWRSHELSFALDWAPVRLEGSYFMARRDLVDLRNRSHVYQTLANTPEALALRQSYGWPSETAGLQPQDSAPSATNKPPGRAMDRQINLALSSRLSEFWSGRVFIIRDLGPSLRRGRTLSQGIGISYQDECFASGATLQRLAFRLRDLQPGYSVTFFVALKNLGGIQQTHQRFFKPDAQGLFSPAQVQEAQSAASWAQDPS